MPSSSRSSPSHTRVFPQCTFPLEEHPCVTAVPHHCGHSAPSRLCSPEYSAETDLQKRPPPRGFAPSHPVGQWFWLPATHTTQSFLGFMFPFEVHCSLAATCQCRSTRPHKMSPSCARVLPPEPDLPPKKLAVSPADRPKALTGSSPCWMLSHPLFGWADTEAPSLRRGLSK